MMVDALVEGEIGELEVSALTGLNTDLRRAVHQRLPRPSSSSQPKIRIMIRYKKAKRHKPRSWLNLLIWPNRRS